MCTESSEGSETTAPTLTYERDLVDPDPKVRLRGFSKLHADVYLRLYEHARRIFPTLGEHAWADGATNALLKIWRKIEAGQYLWTPGEQPRASLNLLFCIVRRQTSNEYRSLVRRQARARSVELDEEADVEAAIIQSEEYRRSQARREWVAELEEGLLRAISELPCKQQRMAEIVYNTAEDGLTLEEIRQLYQSNYGEEITVAAAKSLKRIVERKVTAALTHRIKSKDSNAAQADTLGEEIGRKGDQDER
jgi:DNA-directed RNA polymerase specialized sigma24 family protein